MRAVSLVVLAVLFFTGGASAQSDILNVDQAFRMSASRNVDGSLQLTWDIAPGYYLYRDHFSVEDGDTAASIAIALPPGLQKDDPNFGPSEIFHDRVEISVPAWPSPMKIGYQGCKEDSICYPPVSKMLDPGSLAISETSVAGLAIDLSSPGQNNRGQSGFHLAGDIGDGLIPSLLNSGGPVWVVLSFLIFGVLLSFTPCVLPMYPILAATLARSGENLSVARGFTLSSIYVLAMASGFGLLGLVAAWSGRNLQIVLQSPYAVGAAALIFTALAASMFGAFELRLPDAWINRVAGAPTGPRGSAKSAAFLGFSSTLIVGPCVTAPLAAALLYLGQAGDPWLGAIALFALGLGQGIPLIAFGTLGSRAIPRTGPWMLRVKYVFGLVFLGVATWMASRIVPPPLMLGLWSILLVGAAVFLGGFDAIRTDTHDFVPRLRKAAGIGVAIYGAALGIGALGGATDPTRPLQFLFAQGALPSPAEKIAFTHVASAEALQQELASAASDRRPTMVYFTADWCVTCKVIEQGPFASTSILDRLEAFRSVKVDLTAMDEKGRALMQDLGVVGPPTLIFFDASSSEVAGTRLVGDVSVSSLLASATLGANQ